MTAVEDGYAEQDPTVVGRELQASGARFAEELAAVPTDAWGRSGRRSDGAVCTVETFARYFVPDPVHHLYDVTG